MATLIKKKRSKFWQKVKGTRTGLQYYIWIWERQDDTGTYYFQNGHKFAFNRTEVLNAENNRERKEMNVMICINKDIQNAVNFKIYLNRLNKSYNNLFWYYYF